ncbi:Pc22g25750 [Penicillium rubens Wisconsin 54-1255]|uniref:Pc22g25750 protein n=1 Tax=Penicillium rubens (strain ATCC 28089 / DSM 1075 / NRRL 1951 / Wisconsin 54-1255) TaxID=500485 RepID=B6HSZ0_PENRW|nr:Pc22g25750 [Penicillium rubens Wisconsin 54-1255]
MGDIPPVLLIVVLKHYIHADCAKGKGCLKDTESSSRALYDHHQLDLGFRTPDEPTGKPVFHRDPRSDATQKTLAQMLVVMPAIAWWEMHRLVRTSRRAAKADAHFARQRPRPGLPGHFCHRN